ncbi:MAG: hypothetical protein ACREJL_00960 [Candidatus Methylomirabilales bacterium]
MDWWPTWRQPETETVSRDSLPQAPLCPNCGGHRTAYILRGNILITPEVRRLEAEGAVILKPGDVVTYPWGLWYCWVCGREFGGEADSTRALPHG